MQAIKTILHPTDFSESSKHAMSYAISFAQEFQAKLVLLHVIEEISSALYFDMLQAPPLTQLMVNIEKQAKQALDEVLPPELRGKLQTEYILRKGVPFVVILQLRRPGEGRHDRPRHARPHRTQARAVRLRGGKGRAQSRMPRPERAAPAAEIRDAGVSFHHNVTTGTTNRVEIRASAF